MVKAVFGGTQLTKQMPCSLDLSSVYCIFPGCSNAAGKMPLHQYCRNCLHCMLCMFRKLVMSAATFSPDLTDLQKSSQINV